MQIKLMLLLLLLLLSVTNIVGCSQGEVEESRGLFAVEKKIVSFEKNYS